MSVPLFIVYGVCLLFQNSHFGTPAGQRPAAQRGNLAILPGGRVVSPRGTQLITGPGAFGLSVSPAGRILTANLGPERLSVTAMEQEKHGTWLIHNLVTARPGKSSETASSKSKKDDDDDWKSVFMGISFSGEKNAWVAEGNSGRVRLIEVATGNGRRTIDLNTDGYSDSFSGDLICDETRGLLYVTDQANFRVVIIDSKRFTVLSSIKTGRLPFALALSADRQRLYVTNVGVFAYSAIPGATKSNAAESGLPFPAFSFPSPESITGKLQDGKQIPALGDPNTAESNSLAVIDVGDPAAPKLLSQIRTGLPFAADRPGGSSPSGVTASANRIYVSNAHDDSITIIDASTLKIVEDLNIRIPGLESLRGIMPIGVAVDPKSGNLLAACAGINALAILDFAAKRLSFIPVGWFPTRVAIRNGTAYVSNAKGQGTGQNAYNNFASFQADGLFGTLRRGTVSVFPIPEGEDLRKDTQTVFSANGFNPQPGPEPPMPREIRHVVVIVKENRTFDEVFGDLGSAPRLARFGTSGMADGGHVRLSVQRVNITPNHHAIAQQWMLSDNFYADSEVSVDGHHWLVGNYPDPWTESSLMAAYAGQKDFRFPTTAPGRLLFAGSSSSVHPEEIQEAGTIWHHLERNNITFRNFGEGFELAGVQEGEGLKPFGVRFLTNVPVPAPLWRNSSREYPGFNMNIPDQFRAGQFIHEIQELYEKPGKPLPQFIFIHLPNDHMTKPRPEDGYPFGASYVADNDYALGRIVEYLSHTPWWKEMAIFVTEDDAQGGKDHIDSHRTVLLGASPWFKRNYVSHTNTSFPGLLKTVFRLLGVPPLNLYDATASDLSDVFTETPDFTPYTIQQEDPRVFIPAEAREPKDPKPSVRMDSRDDR